MSSYYISILMASIKRLAISCVDKALNQVKFCYTLMGMFSGVPLWKKSLHWKSTLKFILKLSIHVSCNPEIPHLGICPRKIEAPSQENWNASAHSIFFFFLNSQNVKQVKYLSGRKKKQIVVDPHNRLFLRNKKQGTSVTRETGRYQKPYVEWKKSDPKVYLLCDSVYIKL